MVYYYDLLDGDLGLFLLTAFEGFLFDLEISLDHVDLFLDVLVLGDESLEKFKEILGCEYAIGYFIE